MENKSNIPFVFAPLCTVVSYSSYFLKSAEEDVNKDILTRLILRTLIGAALLTYLDRVVHDDTVHLVVVAILFVL